MDLLFHNAAKTFWKKDSEAAIWLQPQCPKNKDESMLFLALPVCTDKG